MNHPAAEIRRWAESRHLPENYLQRWLAWADVDQAALLELARANRMRVGQCVAAIDLLEEISVRDQLSVGQILAGPGIMQISKQTGSGPAKAAALLDQLRALRYPRLTQTRLSIDAWIAQLRLPPAIRLSYAPDLASDALRVELVAHGGVELHELIEVLSRTSPDLCAIAEVVGGASDV